MAVEIEAQIAGSVWKIEKAVGDTVQEEDVILIIESMKMEIPVIAADNLAIERANQVIDGDNYVIPLHGALIRDLGIVLSEIYWLDDLAESSAKDGRYSFFFNAAPLKMKGGSGSPVNPIVIK